MTVYNKLAMAKGTLLDEVERPGSFRERRDCLNKPHVKDLEQWVRRLEKQRHESIPSCDPSSAGINARALFLLQDPSKAASQGGFISIDNNDQTAHNATKAYETSGLDYGEALHWNVIPWWVANPEKTRPGRTLTSEAKRAHPDLLVLIEMLERLEVVVLLGKPALGAWTHAGGRARHVLSCPHPSQQAWNNVDSATGRLGRDLTIETFGEVARLLNQA